MNTANEQNDTHGKSFDFESDVLKASHPVLVMFFTAWSQPCRVLERVVDRFAETCGGRVKVIKINADDHPGLSLLYDIQSIPALLYFINGKVGARSVGTVSTAAILAQWQSILEELGQPKQAKGETKTIK